MAYKQYDKNGSEITREDLQNKGIWCEVGASFEEVFIKKYGSQFAIIINPQKQYDKYAPDLFNINSNRLGDLKTQNTPFYQAFSRYGFDPQYTVTFNKKDRMRYQKLYPQIDIYFWVDWISVRFLNLNSNDEVSIKPDTGIWYIQFEAFNKILDNSPLHYYQQRYNDTRGNATASYVIDLRLDSFTRLV